MFQNTYDRLQKILHGCEQNARTVTLTLSAFETLAKTFCELLDSCEGSNGIPSQQAHEALSDLAATFKTQIEEGLPRALKAQADLDQLQASVRDLCEWLENKYGVSIEQEEG